MLLIDDSSELWCSNKLAASDRFQAYTHWLRCQAHRHCLRQHEPRRRALITIQSRLQAHTCTHARTRARPRTCSAREAVDLERVRS